MAEAFDALCNQVTNALLKNVNHLARGTRTILKTTKLTNVPTLIGKKNFTLTSNSHLAALFIKIIPSYVNIKYDNYQESKKIEKLTKYIWQLQKGTFEEPTKQKISKTFKSQCSKFFDLIDKPNKFEKILLEAKKLTQRIELDGEKTTEIATTRQQIAEIIAEANDYTTDLRGEARDKLSEILTKIETKCKNTEKTEETAKIKNQTKLQDELITILKKPEIVHADCDSPVWDQIRTEVAALKYVIMNWKNADIDEQFVKQLKHCHKSTIKKLIKTKKQIVDAYANIDTANTKAKTPVHESSSSEPNGSAAINQQQNPRTPKSPPPSLPTSDVSDQPPPLRPVKTNEIQKSSNPRKPSRQNRGEPPTQKLKPPPTLTAPPGRNIELNSGKAKPKPTHKPRKAP